MEDRRYIDETLRKYLEDLSAKLPAPGGGSASALTGATGFALLCMVLNFTLGKKEFKDVEEKLKELLKQCERKRRRLEELIDEDVKVYGEVSRTYALPRNSDEEKRVRSQAIQKALRDALEVPLEIASLSREGLETALELIEISNPKLVSDIGGGAVFLEGAFRGAELNVKINLAAIKDKELTMRKGEEWDRMSKDVKDIKEELWHKTLDRMNL